MNAVRFLALFLCLFSVTISSGQDIKFEKPPKAVNEYVPKITQYSVWLGAGFLGLNYSQVWPFGMAGGFEICKGKFALDLAFAGAKTEWVSQTQAYPDRPYYFVESESKRQAQLLIKYNLLKLKSRSRLYLYSGIGFSHIKFRFAGNIITNYSGLMRISFAELDMVPFTWPSGVSYEFAVSNKFSIGSKIQLDYTGSIEKVTAQHVYYRNGSTSPSSSTYGSTLTPGGILYLKYYF